MVFPIELVLPIDGRDAGEVLGEGDVPEFVAEAWVRGDIVVDIKTLLSDWHRCVPMLVVRTGAGATGAQYADIGRLGLEITA